MTLLEKARRNRRLALSALNRAAHRAHQTQVTAPRDIRAELVVITGDKQVRPSDFDPDLGLRLAA